MTPKKIVYASAVRVEELRTEVDQILRHISKLMKEPGESEDDWLDYVFVSDESRLGDFLSKESDLLEFRFRLAMPDLNKRDTITAIAFAVRTNKPMQTIQ